MAGNIISEALILVEKPIAKAVLGAALSALEGLTPEELSKAAVWINSKVGGNEKFEDASLAIVVKGAIAVVEYLEKL